MTQKTTRRTAQILALALLGASAAQAELLTNYDTWVVDRYTPTGFANAGAVNGRDDVLKVDITAAGVQPGVFENTQGKGYALTAPAADYAVVYGSLYVPADWENSADATTARRSDLWGFVSSSAGPVPEPHYPIVGFVNTGADGSGDASAGTGRMRVWDSTSGWVPGSVQPVQYDAWNNMCMVLTGGTVQTYVNGVLAHTQTDLSLDSLTGDQFSKVVVNTFNYGSDYSALWSNIGAGELTAVAASEGAGQSATVNAAFATPLTVEARDASGAPLPCVPVTFTVPADGASATLSTTTVMTDYLGRATGTATANGTAGSYEVTATVEGLDVPASLNLTNAAATGPTTPTTQVTAVPTLGEWSLIVMSLMLGAVGLRRMRRSA